MKKLLLLLVALCASAFTAEISGHGYRVTSDQAGTRIYYQGILLQTNVFPSIVEGPGWKRALLDDHDIRKATAVVNAENQLEITYPGKTKEATGHLKIAISEAGVALTYSFEDTVAEVGVADLWFCALPLERFANQKYVVGNGDKEGILPTTKELETEKKSKWRLHNDTKEIAIQMPYGTLTISGDYMHLFDARFHGHLPAKGRTIAIRTDNHLKAGQNYRFKFSVKE